MEVCAVAKRDLRAGETLDDYGEFMTYGEAVGVEEMSERRYLPEGLVEGCVLRRDVARDEVITYDDVDLPRPGDSRTASAPSSTCDSAARPGCPTSCLQATSA